MNIKGPGRMFDRGEIMRFISAAARPARRTIATISDPRQMLPSEVPVARWTAAVVTSSASDLVSSLTISFAHQRLRSLPVEVPFANDSCDCYFTHSPDHAPGPEPGQGDEDNEPSGIWANMEHPGIVASDYQLMSTLRSGQLTDDASTLSCPA